MNLSHVEYYFADFLSVLESGRDQNGRTKETIKLHNVDSNNVKENVKEGKKSNLPPKEINLPPNLYIIGSVNIDETTYMFSPKVLDRAFAIEFKEVNLDDYSQIEIDKEKAKSIVGSIRNSLLEDLRNINNKRARFCGAVADKEEIKEALNWIKKEENKVKSGNLIFDELKDLNQILQPYDLHFGYRVLDEIALFIKYATNAPNEVGKLSPEKALDFAVFMKVLPKFHGPRQKLERPLWSVLRWCALNKEEFDNKKPGEIINLLEDLLKEKVKLSEKFKYPRTAIKVLRMLRQLYETGFTSFA
jgi:5-methylcytosine-specific restriction endonuclease McrBC GTP-binding regulatory subunit McrB